MKRNAIVSIIVLSTLVLTPALAREAGSGHHDGTTHHGASHVTSREAEPRDDRGRHTEPGDDRGHGGHQEPGDDHGQHGGGHR